MGFPPTEDIAVLFRKESWEARTDLWGDGVILGLLWGYRAAMGLL